MAYSNDLANGDSITFWNSAAEGHLVFQKCEACGEIQFPPRHICAHCWSEDLTDVQSSGKGVIESATVVRRAPIPSFRDRVPYVVAAVLVEEGPRMITNIVGEGALDVTIGDPVAVTFVADDEGRLLPQFQLTKSKMG